MDDVWENLQLYHQEVLHKTTHSDGVDFGPLQSLGVYQFKRLENVKWMLVRILH